MSGSLLFVSGSSAGGGAFSATATPAVLSGYKYGPGTVTSAGFSQVVVTGGKPPYTYLWEFVSGSTQILPTAPTSYLTYFSAYFELPGNHNDTFRCKVTDANAVVTYTNNVDIELTSGEFA